MTDNEKLCKFQGWQTTKDGKHLISIAKDYLNDDTAAMSLLDTLVEKGYDPALIYFRGTSAWHMQIFDGEENLHYTQRPTRRAAVCAAVLELIERGDI